MEETPSFCGPSQPPSLSFSVESSCSTSSRVKSIDYHPEDPSMVLIATYDGICTIWSRTHHLPVSADLDTKEKGEQVDGKGEDVVSNLQVYKSYDISADTGLSGGTLRVARFLPASAGPLHLNLFVCAGDDMSLYFYDYQLHSLVKTVVQAHTDHIKDLAIQPVMTHAPTTSGGRGEGEENTEEKYRCCFATASDDSSVILWRVTAEAITNISRDANKSPSSGSSSESDMDCSTGRRCSNYNLVVQRKTLPHRHDHYITCIKFHPMQEGAPTSQGGADTSSPNSSSVNMSSIPRGVFATSSYDGEIKVWTTSISSPARNSFRRMFHNSEIQNSCPVSSFDFFPATSGGSPLHNELLVSFGADGTAVLHNWVLRTAQRLFSHENEFFFGHQRGAYSLAPVNATVFFHPFLPLVLFGSSYCDGADVAVVPPLLEGDSSHWRLLGRDCFRSFDSCGCGSSQQVEGEEKPGDFLSSFSAPFPKVSREQQVSDRIWCFGASPNSPSSLIVGSDKGFVVWKICVATGDSCGTDDEIVLRRGGVRLPPPVQLGFSGH